MQYNPPGTRPRHIGARTGIAAMDPQQSINTLAHAGGGGGDEPGPGSPQLTALQGRDGPN